MLQALLQNCKGSDRVTKHSHNRKPIWVWQKELILESERQRVCLRLSGQLSPNARAQSVEHAASSSVTRSSGADLDSCTSPSVVGHHSAKLLVEPLNPILAHDLSFVNILLSLFATSPLATARRRLSRGSIRKCSTSGLSDRATR
jgi:hypothetical protein